MARLTRLMRGFRAEVSGQILSQIGGIVLVVVLARTLNPDAYGLLFLSISVFSIIGLLSKLGIARAGARYINEYKETNPSQIPVILKKSFIFNALVLSIVILLFIPSHHHIAEWIGEPRLVPLFLLGIFYIIFETLEYFARHTLQGFEEIRTSAGIKILNTITKVIFAIVLVSLGFGAVGALAGYILGFFASSLTGLLSIFARHYKSNESGDAPEADLGRKIIHYSIPLTLTDAASALDKQVDTVLVGFFLNPIAVSSYVISKQIIGVVRTPFQALGFTISPTYAADIGRGNPEKARSTYHTALENGFLIYLPAMTGLILLAEPTIRLVFGENYLGASSVLQILSLYLFFTTITTITSGGLDYLGRAKVRAIAYTLAAIANVFLNVLLIPLIGVEGAAYATVLTYGSYTIINIYLIHLELNLNTSYLLTRIMKIFGITTLMSIVVWFTRPFIQGLFTLGLVVLLGVLCWLILGFLTGLLRWSEMRKVLP